MSINEHPPQDEPKARLHVPVLLDTCIDVMQPKQAESYLDLTAGYGGHAAAFLAKTNAYSNAVLVDRDQMAINELAVFEQKGATLLHTDFVSAAQALREQGRQFDLIFVDLGVSSPQLDRAERGFSFSMDGPLDMRMDQRLEKNAATLVNTAREAELVRIITMYGEERTSVAKRIAKAIIAQRPFSSTKELSDCVLGTHRGSWQRTHPATRTFQALRIAVNDELGQLETLLRCIPDLLTVGGRVGILSFHSLEDRLVKRFFKEHAEAGYEADLDVLTKKPIDGATHDVHNPRSRSAKLRVAVKK
ncbi:MAG TPA: 16S rRNA (cytosine(1402)-N(4))-methyltransferase RsmH [Candidatus Saccharibacteria bacterium]|nr:16S rRNA (cytosine(1402)-N(4))-methyltransferase RsmH [Candidatus Saccharibacteria bacterium]